MLLHGKKKKGRKKEAPVSAGIPLFVMCAADKCHTRLGAARDVLWVSWVGVEVREKVVRMDVCPRKQVRVRVGVHVGERKNSPLNPAIFV